MTATEAKKIVDAIKPNHCLSDRQIMAQRVVAQAKAEDEAEAKDYAEKVAAARAGGGVPQVRRQTSLRRSHSLVWTGSGNLPNAAEIWGADSRSIYRGTLAACREEAIRRGLTW